MEALVIEIAKKLGVQTIGTDFGDLNITKTLEAINGQLDKVPYIPYPTSFPTIDVIIWRRTETNEVEILLGQKKNEHEFWRIPGGFREPSHTNEGTVAKEAKEETNLTLTNVTYKDYIGSFFIDDARYIGSCHKVTTSLFSVEVDNTVEAKGGDDLPRVQWFNYNDLVKNYNTIIIDVHRALFEHFVYLTNQ